MLVRDAVRPWVAKLLGHGAGLTLDTHVRVIDALDDAPGSRLSSDLPGALSFDHGASTGLRLRTRDPDVVNALVSSSWLVV